MAPIKASTLSSLHRSIASPRPLNIATRAINSTSRSQAPTQSPISRTQPQPLDFLHQSSQTSWPSQQQPPVPVTHQNNFNNLLRSLISSLTTTPTPDTKALLALLVDYSSKPSDWERYALANPSKDYTRNLVCEVPGLFNLLLLVWTPGKASPIHDHADAHCCMKVLQGSLVERHYEFPQLGDKRKARMVMKAERKHGEEDVTYICDNMGLHSISNPSATQYAVSLHCEF